MVAKRTSPIWRASKEELEVLVSKYTSYKLILAHFGLENKGHNYKTLKLRMDNDGIRYDHFLKHGQNLNALKTLIPLESILIEGSTFSRGQMKRRLLQSGLLDNRCYECDLTTLWNNKPIVLQLDHINGISNDNRLENLRILCPNCHSQTYTFSGKNSFAGKKNAKRIADRQRSIDEHGYVQRADRPEKRKVVRPSKEELQLLLWEKPTTQIAKQFDVSDKAVEKWCKRYGISKPTRGYWAKMRKKNLTSDNSK